MWLTCGRSSPRIHIMISSSCAVSDYLQVETSSKAYQNICQFIFQSLICIWRQRLWQCRCESNPCTHAQTHYTYRNAYTHTLHAPYSYAHAHTHTHTHTRLTPILLMIGTSPILPRALTGVQFPRCGHYTKISILGCTSKTAATTSITEYTS